MSFTFDAVERFIAGTVGEPGERAFFIQARNGTRLISVALEKAQVGALAERLGSVINDLKRNGVSHAGDRATRDDGPLEHPIESEFDVGAISIAWDGDSKVMGIEFFENVAEGSGTNLSLKVSIDLGMCDAFVQRTKALLRAGRTPCPLCGIPIDPQGHLCPRANGYRR